MTDLRHVNSPADLTALREADDGLGASERVEAELLQAFDAYHAPVRNDWRRWLAVAAVLVVSVGTALGWLGSQRANRADLAAEEEVFIAWPGAATLPEFEGGVLVRTTLPAAVLPLLGIAAIDAATDTQVTADVLLGQDGQPRAVRIVGPQP